MKALMGAVLLVSLIVAGAVLAQTDKAKGKENSMQTISGRCHCGHIQYEATGAIIKSSYCDCRGCQRATGTLKAPFVTVHRASVKITAGQLSEFRAQAGEKCDAHGVWQFCSKCGTQMFWKGDKGDELDVFAGTLDDAKVFQPKE